MAEGVNPEPGLRWGFIALVGVYAVLTVVLIAVLRYLARIPLPKDQP